MPNECHSGVRGIPWHRCDICGQDNRTSALVRQAGLNRGILVCPKCVDDPLTYYRDIIIRENLSQNADTEAAVADILRQPISDDSPVF